MGACGPLTVMVMTDTVGLTMTTLVILLNLLPLVFVLFLSSPLFLLRMVFIEHFIWFRFFSFRSKSAELLFHWFSLLPYSSQSLYEESTSTFRQRRVCPRVVGGPSGHVVVMIPASLLP